MVNRITQTRIAGMSPNIPLNKQKNLNGLDYSIKKKDNLIKWENSHINYK